MFNFLHSKQIEKEIALPFKVTLELKDDGFFLATCPSMPGCSARGRTKSDALRNISEAIQNHLNLASTSDFEIVWEDFTHPTLNALGTYFGRVVAGSNRDGALSSSTGDRGAWTLSPVTGAASVEPQGAAPRSPDLDSELVDYTPQIYCLSAFAGGSSAARLFAGTSASGAIYESVDGLSWDLSYATGEARVHSLCVFKNRLYAGTSASGKLFCFTGAHWSLMHRSSETAITALAEFNGEFFMGTYPGGHIYASLDGVNWHLAYDSEQTFVRSFAVFQGALYAATSKSSGGMVLRSKDGLRWEKVFESKDPNYYCLHVFQHGLWLGTGNNGKVYRTQDGDRWRLSASLEDEGVRAMETYEGRLYLAAEGHGRIYRSRFSDTMPPEIFDVKVTDITSHTAVVRWRSDRPSDSHVLYGLDEDYGAELREHFPVTEHKIALSYLRSLTTYHFKVSSRCPDFSGAGFSLDLVFTTGAAETAVIHSSTHPVSSRWYGTRRAVLNWNAPEGITRFHYLLDRESGTVPVAGQQGAVSTTEHSAQFQDLEDGVWWFHLLCQDRAGNFGTVAEHFCLRVDTNALPPRVKSSTHPSEGAWSNRSKAQWSWEAPPDLSGIAGYWILLDQKPDTVPGADSGIWSESPSHSAELGVDGDWFLHVSSADMAGNVGGLAGHYQIRLDRRADPPRLESSTHPDPSAWVNSSNVELRWSEPSDASGVVGYYTLFDTRPETVPTVHTGTFTLLTQANFSGRADGLWYFHIVTADQAGNIGSDAAHYPIRIDTWAAPPEVQSSTHPAGIWVSSSRVVFDLTPPDDLSGTAGYYYVLDKEKATLPSTERGTFTAERSIEFSGLSDGIWTLHVVSKDHAGNVGVEAAHVSARVDTEARPPLLSSLSHPNQEDWSRQAAVDMVWDAPQDLSGVASYYTLLDREPDTVPTVHSGNRCTENRTRVLVPEDGVWYFHAVTQDRAGNIGRQATHYKLRIDTSALPPRLICPTHPDRQSWSNHTRPRFEWFEPEDSSGVVGYYYCFDRETQTLPTPVSGFYTTERYAVIDRGLDEDGTWYFHVVSRDRAGNVGIEAAHYSINLDTTALPPLISSSSHPDKHAWSNNPNATFTWAAPEDPSGIAGYYTLLNHSQSSVPAENNGVWTEEPRASYAGLEDGVWTLHVVSRDRCGNIGTQAAHYSIRIDTQALPPSLSSPTHPEGNWARNASPTFTWEAPTDLSGIAGYYTALDREPSTVPGKDNGQFTTANLASFSKLGDGIWIFHVVSVDQAGNVGTRAAHYSVHVDTQAEAPKVSSTTHPDPGKWYRNASPQFSWAAPPDPSGISGYYYCVDQSPGTNPGPQSSWSAENQIHLPEFPDGEWYFHLVTKDGAGNMSLEAAHFRFRIDSSVPKPRIFSKTHPNPDNFYGNARPSFVWEDGDDLSGIAGHYWLFDKQASSPVQASSAAFSPAAVLTLPPQKDGVWFFHLAAKDNAGNISEAAHIPCRIETEAPSTKFSPIPSVTSQGSVELSWIGVDRVSGVASYDVELRHNGGPWQPYLSETTLNSSSFSGSDGGVYEFRARATDKAGNQESFDAQGPYPKIIFDLSPPEPIKSLAARPAAGGSVQLSWSSALDSGSGVSHYEVYRSTGASELGTLISSGDAVKKTSYVDPGNDLVDGALYYYTVVPVDKASNRALEGNASASSLSDKVAKAPALSSPTHPMTLDWYNSTDARLVWDTPADSTGIIGYYWSVDQSLNSIPGVKNGTYIETNGVEIKGLKDGTWYAHVVSKDRAGNISTEAAHYQLNVDLTKPPAPQLRSTSHPNPDSWSSSMDASFSWSAPQDISKIAGYYSLLDQNPSTLPTPTTGAWTQSNHASFDELGEGIWYFHVVAKDGAGNLGEQAAHARIQLSRTPPPPLVSSPTHPKAGAPSSVRSVVFHWKAPVFAEPITAYHFVLDRQKDSVPTLQDPRSIEERAEFKDLEEGDWHFHVASVDSAGRLGKLASHYALSIRSSSSLGGQVTKSNGILPFEGIAVEAFLKGKSVGKTSTDKEGRFRFASLEPGEYLLKLDAPGLAAQLLDGIRLAADDLNLALSTEVCAVPNPSAGAKEIRFFVLAKEAGSMSLKVYKESGTVMAALEASVARPAYQKLAWNASAVEPGIYLYQATLTGQSGKIIKYPIRKVQIT